MQRTREGNSSMNAKRGYVPEDDRNFSPEAVSTLKTASRHVIYLINEGYDLKQATVFAGNHFMLSERQRLSIMRSVATRQQLTDRKEKQVSFDDLSGKDVWIDGFNTIITLEVLLCDSLLFCCMDGTIRDLAAKALIADIAEAGEYSFDLDIQIRRDVDRALYGKERVITTDSIILDHCASWVNLTAECVNRKEKQGIQVWAD